MKLTPTNSPFTQAILHLRKETPTEVSSKKNSVSRNSPTLVTDNCAPLSEISITLHSRRQVPSIATRLAFKLRSKRTRLYARLSPRIAYRLCSMR